MSLRSVSVLFCLPVLYFCFILFRGVVFVFVFLFLHNANVHSRGERSVSAAEEKTPKKAAAQVHLLLFN